MFYLICLNNSMPITRTKRLFSCVGNRRHNYLHELSMFMLHFPKWHSRFSVPLRTFAEILLYFWKHFSPWRVGNWACAPGSLRNKFKKLTSKYLRIFLLRMRTTEKQNMAGWYFPPMGCWIIRHQLSLPVSLPLTINTLSVYSISLNFQVAGRMEYLRIR